MALNLINNPVTTEGGIVKNLFAGFLPVNFEFKREDLAIVSVGLGVGQYIRITIGADLTSKLNIGDSLYLSAVGVSGYEYEKSGTITAITATTIDCTIDFVESATVGYINYLKNWFLEVELVDPVNPLIKLLPFTLRNDGDLAGNITLDISIGNDLNNQIFQFITDQLEASRTALKVQYRDVFEGSSTSFTLIDTEIVLVYATEQPDQESFLNSLDDAEFYEGYPFVSILVHSNDNSDDTGIDIKYDELDINKTDLTVDNAIANIDSNKQGFISANIDKTTVWNASTEYIRLKAIYTGLAFFDGTYFDNTFFETT